MFCKKCGRKLDGNNICPYCSQPRNVIFIISIIAASLSVIAFNVVIMITGIIISLASFIWGLVLYKKNKTYPKIGISLTLSITGLISNILWYWFYCMVL